MTTTLADVLGFIDDPSDYEITIDGHAVTFIDDYGLSCGTNSEFFAIGHEFGASHLVHASDYESAWEVWLDEQDTIPESEVAEAYGLHDEFRVEYQKTDPAPAWHEREAYDAWKARFDAACLVELRREGAEHELIEGYEYQSNASGTGIVDVGHYSWCNEADLTQVTITKRESKAKGAANG
jgi:hypothetical protein